MTTNTTLDRQTFDAVSARALATIGCYGDRSRRRRAAGADAARMKREAWEETDGKHGSSGLTSVARVETMAVRRTVHQQIVRQMQVDWRRRHDLCVATFEQTGAGRCH